MKEIIIFCLYLIIIYCLIKNFYSQNKDIELSDHKVDIIVSLTSTPDRINDSKKTVLSLLKQSYLPKQIVFNIPYFSSKNVEYKIPEWLIRLSKKYPLIKINRCEKDYGPATKVIPTLFLYKYYPEQKILYIDDDMIYPSNFVKHFYDASLEHPNDVVCYSGYNIDDYNKNFVQLGPVMILLLIISIIFLFLTTSFLIFKNHWKIIIALYTILFVVLYWFFSSKKREVNIVEGWSGVLVNPSHFNFQTLLDFEKYPKELFYDDDVYLSGHLTENGIKKYEIKFFGVPLPTFHKNFFKTLSFTSNSDGENKKIGHSCFKWE